MKEELITSETAKLAKEKGCDLTLYKEKEFEYTDEDGNEYFTTKEGGICGTRNTKRVTRCTQSLLQKCLRTDHFIYVSVIPRRSHSDYSGPVKFQIVVLYKDKDGYVNTKTFFLDRTLYKTYEEVLEKGLYESLKLIQGESKIIKEDS